MKVLYITTTPTPYKVDFFEELGKQCELTVLFERKSVSYRNNNWMRRNFKNFKGIFLRGFEIRDKMISFEIFKYIKQDYDFIIIGVYSTITEIFAQIYMKKRNIPYIISSDGGFIKKDKYYQKKVKSTLLKNAKYYLSTGEMTSNYLKHYGANENNIFIYPFSSIHDDDIWKSINIAKEKTLLKKELEIKEKKMIISVGQYIYRKGFDLLIKNANNWKETGIYIIGGTPTQEYIELKEKYNAKNVHFINFLSKEELTKFYRAADLFILPTREDIWGLVINEAMANGLPIITTDKCIAGLEMIENGEIGDIFEANNEGQLIKCVNKWLDKSIDFQKILDIANKYTIERMALVHKYILTKLKEKE